MRGARRGRGEPGGPAGLGRRAQRAGLVRLGDLVPGGRLRGLRMLGAVGVVALILTSAAHARATAAAPHNLSVDGLDAPIGVGLDDVQFAWQDTVAIQPSYRIVVRSSAGVVWDSGEIASADESAIPYGGRALAPATVYTWTVTVAGGSTSSTFETGLRDQDWRASWIRRPTEQVPQYTFARKEVTLGSSPIVRARAYVSADQQYEFTVNGTRVGKGEAYSYPDHQYYETLDLTHAVRAGQRNAFALLYTWDGATKGHPAGAPGVIAQIEVAHADGTVERVVTDGSWRVLAGNWLPGSQRDEEGDTVDWVENINGLAYPNGWDRAGYDDRSWTPAAVVGRAGVAPWTHLVSVRTRVVETLIHPVSVRHLPTGAWLADFGEVFAAVPAVTFHHGIPGLLVKMRAGYLLNPLGGVAIYHGTQHTNMSYSYVEPAGTSTFQPFDYLGFRYFEVEDPGLDAPDIVAFARHAAVPPTTATFSSSDPTIDAVWRLAAHSALYTTQESFIDTPTREKGPWLWDGFNESQTAMAAFGESNVTRKALLEYAASQARYWPTSGRINKIYPTGLGAEDINEFSEIYVEWVWQYWLASGDRALLADVYPTLLKLSDYVARAIKPSTGLVTNLPATNIYYAFPVVTRLNILGVNVFRRTADVAGVLGLPVDRSRQAALSAAVNRELTRPNGLYVDGLQKDGTQTGVTQEANIAALAYGLVPAARVGTVAAYIASQGMGVPPRIAGELLAAMRAGDRDPVDLLTNPHHDGWANILARGGTFTWEVWEPSDANGDSMSHGWGSNVLVEIDRTLLGVTPTSGGYATFAVAPAPFIQAASGSVPTPHGSVDVAWQRGGVLRLTVPPNASATVRWGAQSYAVGSGTYAFPFTSSHS